MAYTIDRVRKEFTEICSNANTYVTVPIEVNRRLTRTLGRVCLVREAYSGKVKPIKVEFSKSLLETATDEAVLEIIKHEAAHYIATCRTGENHGHDAYFKKICKEIGTSNNKTTCIVERIAEQPTYKYTVSCPECRKEWGYSRMCNTIKYRDMCTCPCGHTGLKVVQNW